MTVDIFKNRVLMKIGLDPDCLKPEIWKALEIIDSLYPSGIVVTSTCEPVDGRLTRSLHYKGMAVDLRVSTFMHKELSRDLIAQELGPDYDVIRKWGPPHIHIEFQPKGKNREV